MCVCYGVVVGYVWALTLVLSLVRVDTGGGVGVHGVSCVMNIPRNNTTTSIITNTSSNINTVTDIKIIGNNYNITAPINSRLQQRQRRMQ